MIKGHFLNKARKFISVHKRCGYNYKEFLKQDELNEFVLSLKPKIQKSLPTSLPLRGQKHVDERNIVTTKRRIKVSW